jgi:hypothetical protein
MTVDDLVAHLKNRPAAARHPDGARPLHPASGDAGAAGGLGPDLLRAEPPLSPWLLGAGAVRAAQDHIAAGHSHVVDIDLEKFFDRVNHDILMGLVAKRASDRRIL